MHCSFKTVASSVGKLTLVAWGSELTAILWENERQGRVRLGLQYGWSLRKWPIRVMSSMIPTTTAPHTLSA
jgi:hypothetical protein